MSAIQQVGILGSRIMGSGLAEVAALCLEVAAMDSADVVSALDLQPQTHSARGR